MRMKAGLATLSQNTRQLKGFLNESPFFMILFSLAELIFVLSFLIFPPLLNAPKSGALVLDFSKGYPLSVFSVFLIALFIFFMEEYESKISKKTASFAEIEKKSSVISKISIGTVCLGVVFIVSATFKIIELISNGAGFETQKTILPETVPYFVNFAAGTFFSAFSEEVIYRYYLPKALKENSKILSRNKIKPSKQKYLSLFFEFASVCVFALSHRYLGFSPVLNAFFSGAVLRICMIRSNSVLIPFLVHSVYNFSVFIFAWLIG